MARLPVPENCVYPKQCALIARGLEENPEAVIDLSMDMEIGDMLVETPHRVSTCFTTGNCVLAASNYNYPYDEANEAEPQQKKTMRNNALALFWIARYFAEEFLGKPRN